MEAIIYRLYLGENDRNGVSVDPEIFDAQISNLSKVVDGFTLIQGIGFFEGKSEPCTVIEVVSSDRGLSRTLHRWSEEFKRATNQNSVLITESPISYAFVGSSEEVKAA